MSVSSLPGSCIKPACDLPPRYSSLSFFACMTASSAKTVPAIGFLTVHEHAELGLFGGYLVLNAAGRPLEFHCTAPVKASRTQEILYGATLKPFLYGEQIGQTLLAKAKTRPLIVCTDLAAVLAAREFSDVPLVQVLDSSARADKGLLVEFDLGRNRVAVLAQHSTDQQAATDRWKPHAEALDLLEPFTRIREALEEAQRSMRAAA